MEETSTTTALPELRDILNKANEVAAEAGALAVGAADDQITEIEQKKIDTQRVASEKARDAHIAEQAQAILDDPDLDDTSKIYRVLVLDTLLDDPTTDPQEKYDSFIQKATKLETILDSDQPIVLDDRLHMPQAKQEQQHDARGLQTRLTHGGNLGDYNGIRLADTSTLFTRNHYAHFIHQRIGRLKHLPHDYTILDDPENVTGTDIRDDQAIIVGEAAVLAFAAQNVLSDLERLRVSLEDPETTPPFHSVLVNMLVAAHNDKGNTLYKQLHALPEVPEFIAAYREYKLHFAHNEIARFEEDLRISYGMYDNLPRSESLDGSIALVARRIRWDYGPYTAVFGIDIEELVSQLRESAKSKLQADKLRILAGFEAAEKAIEDSSPLQAE